MKLLLDENVEKALFLGLRRRYPGLDAVRVVDVGLEGNQTLKSWNGPPGKGGCWCPGTRLP